MLTARHIWRVARWTGSRKKWDRGTPDFHERLQDGFDMMEEGDPPETLPPQVTDLNEAQE